MYYWIVINVLYLQAPVPYTIFYPPNCIISAPQLPRNTAQRKQTHIRTPSKRLCGSAYAAAGSLHVIHLNGIDQNAILLRMEYMQ